MSEQRLVSFFFQLAFKHALVFFYANKCVVIAGGTTAQLCAFISKKRKNIYEGLYMS